MRKRSTDLMGERMGWLKFAVIAGCVWGNAAYATLEPDAIGGERQELQTISSWMAHLNFYYPDVSVESRDNLQDPQIRQETMQELQYLENVLHTGGTVEKGAFLHIACGLVCGDGPPPRCIKCSAGQD